MRAIWSREADKRAIPRPVGVAETWVTQVHSAGTSGRARGDTRRTERVDEGTKEEEKEVDKQKHHVAYRGFIVHTLLYVHIHSIGADHVNFSVAPSLRCGCGFLTVGGTKHPQCQLFAECTLRGSRPAWQTGTRSYRVRCWCFRFHSDFLFLKMNSA